MKGGSNTPIITGPGTLSNHFFSMWGPGFSYTDNQSSLTKQELSGTTQYGPVNGQRSGTKKYDVYSGVYKRDLKALRIYSDFYQFLFSDNVAALHASPVFKAQRRKTIVEPWSWLPRLFQGR